MSSLSRWSATFRFRAAAVEFERKGVHSLDMGKVAVGGFDSCHQAQLTHHVAGLEEMKFRNFDRDYIDRPSLSAISQ